MSLRKSPYALLLALTAVAACSSDKTPPPADAGGLPEADGAPGADAPGGDAPVGAAADVPDALDAPASGSDGATMARDGGEDAAASPDVALAPPVIAYRKLLDDQWALWSERWTKCFNTPAAALRRDDSPINDDLQALHELSLTTGLTMLSDEKGRACLESLRTLPCEGIATTTYLATCAQVLTGAVARGGFCLVPEDCRDQAADACQPQGQVGCSMRCTPRPATSALGESC
jgi:hypothetical protein